MAHIRFTAWSLRVALAVAAAAVVGYFALSRDTSVGETIAGVRFGMCAMPPHRDCVIDGDTFYVGDQSIRIADINAPEIDGPECAREGEIGAAASTRLVALLNEGPFELEVSGERDIDQYDRLLRIVVRDGRSIGMILVSEGLARDGSNRRRSWCD